MRLSQYPLLHNTYQKLNNNLPILITLISLPLLYLTSSSIVLARTSVADQVAAQEQDYKAALSHYSPDNQQKLQHLQDQIASLNKKYTDQLEQMTETEGLILDEYQKRHPSSQRTQSQLQYYTPRDELSGKDRGEEVRYWVTFAHEAVAYQAAKKYFPYLHGEGSLKSDAKNELSLLRSDLGSTRQKVLNAQKMLMDLVSQ